FQWPRSEQDVRELTPQQYRWLLEGLSIEQKTAIPAVSARLEITASLSQCSGDHWADVSEQNGPS
ncbi:MAG: hypothetical protein PHT04_07780, partial [Eubacteriales bacterium]|nr:hypothetical protein [Eubacteriales bacterium]